MTQLPTFHLNGSSAKALQDEYKEAYQAIKTAREKLSQATCHPRDFYVQEGGSWEVARRERSDALRKLDEVEKYILDWYTETTLQKRQ